MYFYCTKVMISYLTILSFCRYSISFRIGRMMTCMWSKLAARQ